MGGLSARGTPLASSPPLLSSTLFPVPTSSKQKALLTSALLLTWQGIHTPRFQGPREQKVP